MLNNINAIETPFSHRNICWFCGEPSQFPFVFPPKVINRNSYVVLSCPHPRLSVPSCRECFLFAKKAQVNSIWAVKDQVKKSLLQHYKKDLAIGINWTPEILANSEFEGGNFSGFQKSAWFMFEVAKARVNYQGCKMVVNGLTLMQEQQQKSFVFDGINYPSIDDAVSHYAQCFGLHHDYFRRVLAYLLLEKRMMEKVMLEKSSLEEELLRNEQHAFVKAVRFCRLQIGSTPNERETAFRYFKKSNDN